jgi:1,4-dihydroxy-2-naphthoate octaprenyltransferase
MVEYLRVARLPFLVPGLAIYLIGGLWALQQGASFTFMPLLLGALTVLAAQLSVHFSNDYFDVGSDAPGHSTLISGGGGVLLEHPELRPATRRIAIGLIVLSICLGTLLIWLVRASAWTLVLLVLGNLIGWFYSAPPLRFSQRGAGEWCFPLLGGFLTPAVGYLALKGRLDLDGVYFVAPLLIYTLASVLAVEIPDVEADQLGNKRTWIVRNGRPAGFALIGQLLLAASLYFWLTLGLRPSPGPFRPWVAGVLSFVPLGAGLASWIRRPKTQTEATRLATVIVGSLAAFSLLVDGYLLWLAIK